MLDKLIYVKEKLKHLMSLLKVLPKEKIILGVLSVCLIAFLLYESLIAVQLLRLKALDFQFVSKKKLLDSYGLLMEQSDFLTNALRKEEGEFAGLKERFVDKEELSGYFANLRSQINSLNLQVLSINLTPQKDEAVSAGEGFSRFQELPFEISFKGGYFNMMSLILKLEEGSPIFDIESIDIRQQDGDYQQVVAEIKVKIFLLKDLL